MVELTITVCYGGTQRAGLYAGWELEFRLSVTAAE